MSADGVHANIKAIQDMEAACARFAAVLAEKLPEIECEARRVTEALDEKKTNLRHQIAELKEKISDADEDEDVSWERQRVEEAEEEMSSVRRRIRKLDEVVADYRHAARKAEFASSVKAILICNYLRDAGAAITAYLARQLDATDLRSPAGTASAGAASTESTSDLREKIRNARFTSCKKRKGEDRGINISYVLRNGVKVIFKPGAGEDILVKLPLGIARFEQYRREKAVSVLDEILGTDLVPPTETIKYDGLEGSAQLFLDGFETAQKLADAGLLPWPYTDRLSERQRRDFHLLHTLAGNMDNHTGNWMLRPKDGGGFDLALIDHGLCFSEEPVIILSTHPTPGWELDAVDRSRIEKLLATEADWSPRLVELVGSGAVECMKKRARDMIEINRYE